MPRTVPKTVARAAPPSGKTKSTNNKTLRMRTLTPEKDESRGVNAAVELISECEERRRPVRRPRKRIEEEEIEVRWNGENPMVSLILLVSWWLLRSQLLRAGATRRPSK